MIEIPVTVVHDGVAAAVYFAGNFSYLVRKPNHLFWSAVDDTTLGGASFCDVYEQTKVLS